MKYWILRSGSWYTDPVYCQVASRIGHDPDYRDISIGFRLVKTVKQ
jgi:formylglycine-generating enzyme required for sulfatase activity